MKNSQRLHILTNQEISAIYDCPRFNDLERRHYFSLSEKELGSVKLRSINGKEASSKLYFILQLGYFKAKHMFFQLHYIEAEEDVNFILNTYLPNDLIPTSLPTRKFQLSAQLLILNLMGFRDDLNEIKDLILKKSSILVQKTTVPIEIFGELKNLLEKNKMVLPPYSRVQDAIGLALENEENRIIKIIQSNLTTNTEQSLQQLLEIEDVFYKITELKFDAKTFRTQEMKSELSKLQTCEAIYLFSKKIFPQIAISRKNISYYSDLAKMYTVYRLRRLTKELTYFYLICYVHNRYEKIVNNLIQGFAYYVDKYNVDAKKYANNNEPDTNLTINENKKKAGELLRWYTDDTVMKDPGYLIQEKAYKLMSKEDMIGLSKAFLEDNGNDIETTLIWEYHKNNYRCILLNLRPLFQSINFETNSKLENLREAIDYLENLFKLNKKINEIDSTKIPVAHISPKKIVNYFYEENSGKDKVINTYQYEFYLYNAIRTHIKNGQIFVNSSVEYKSFEVDLNISPTWEIDKEKILQELNNPVLLTNIDDTLLSLKNQLEPLIVCVNERAINGENKHIKIKTHRDGTTSWTIPYPKKNDEADNPFYNSIETLTISEVFDFIEQRCGFIKAFKHIKPRYSKSKLDYLGIKATLLANGTTQGTYQFSKRSNLKYQRLQTAEQNHIRLETLRNAAEIIVDYLAALPIFGSYNINNQQHGSIDGKKKKTKRRILKSRHSPKYFGLDIGVVIMTMNLNHIPFVTNIIGANEHEGHYFTYPMLMENLTVIDPAIISTDTAGTNNVNDFLYFLIGKTHAACYRSTADKAETISGFKAVAEYDGLLIKPRKQVNQSLVKESGQIFCQY
ncbi:MAG: Tn3 family transposase [Legionella sp.]|nr:Tn3 family transposase [Legionella sp.]